ncbi:MAG: Lrp/AsnC family transcriptional regulator [Candidatus Odinarchaeia archaeon]
MKLDSIDRGILEMLKEDARVSYKKIAESYGLSIPAVSQRIKRLIKEGIIKKYTIEVDCSKVGINCEMYILLRVKPEYNISEVGQAISQFKEIETVHNITGDYDFVALAKCMDREDGFKLIECLRRIPGIERVTAHFILKTLKS